MTVYTCTCHADLEHLALLRCILACIMCEYIYMCVVIRHERSAGSPYHKAEDIEYSGEKD